MAFASKAYGSGTAAGGGGKRTHTSSDNPLFVTPAKPSTKKDKKQDQNELESDTIISGQGQGLFTVPAPYIPYNVPHHYPMSVPLQQNINGGNVADEIMSMKSLLTKVVDKLEKLDKMVNNIKDMKTSVEAIKKNNDEMKSELTNMKSELVAVKKKNKTLEDRLIDMQSRSMRDNLIFYNIKEEEKVGRDVPEEEKVTTEEILHDFIKAKMKIESEVSFERAHRMGKHRGTGERPRPIVAKFTFHKQREKVRKSSVNLKGSDFGVAEQFPPEIMVKRKQQWPIFKKAREDGKRAKLVADKLFINGQLYQDDDDAISE